MEATPMIVEGRITIASTPRDLFNVLADPAAWAALDSALVEVTPLSRIGPGTTGSMRRRVGPGLTVTTAWTNTEFAPDVRLENLIKGFGYELLEAITLASDGHGTQVTVVDRLVATSIVGRAMIAMSRRIVRRDLDARLTKLKSLLEAGSAAT
jgi:Polyketide cyclase / dehydrase and lipid transport